MKDSKQKDSIQKESIQKDSIQKDSRRIDSIQAGSVQMDRKRKGKLFVIEGLDGSGKATQSQLLYESFLEKGLPVRKVSFPNYKSDSSALVRMYLRGDFGTDPSDVNAYAASSFYAADRFAG